MSSAGLLDILRRHKAGEAVGVTSVCSAHPLVIQAALEQALADDTIALVEATSNQVDQYGGYTGMTPAQFRDLVLSITQRVGLPEQRVVLGGDHLGPNPWRHLPAETAMTEAAALVSAYVEAGFTKIHLDCSMTCADDVTPLGDGRVADRAARLAVVAERAAESRFGASELLYVVGTEVPVPGGAREAIDHLKPTSAQAARATLAAHQQEFRAGGVAAAWDRAVALVVQPGVEFDAWQVFEYSGAGTTDLRRIPDEWPLLVFEAHSTDYQQPARLAELVRDHWAVLKVGPGLTFALREALFALAAIENELVPASARSQLPETLERVMLAEPKWWKTHYEGDAEELRIARRYSYSDRLRYYWAEPAVVDAQQTLIANLRSRPVPLPLISAVLPDQYARIRAGRLDADPVAIAVDHVRDVLRGYSFACLPDATVEG
ncbi:MAG TPA: D-tagatose-bisphosphate aldolase, class II, non-catalytic subunit [Jatrophihabitans sp.]|jgi:D-tagatose-1,6-bisphosphate aldolase subunit GatZ/KbaZ|nr:D-tagatose-bisphosphate aldolase, class II, non-catalytic subunit [Jatrophihabitans sp.]